VTQAETIFSNSGARGGEVILLCHIRVIVE